MAATKGETEDCDYAEWSKKVIILF